MYSIPEELDAGTIVANITAEDPDDKGSTGFLLYSITTANSYFVINQCKSHTHTHTHTHSFTFLCIFNLSIWIVLQIFYLSFGLGHPFLSGVL